jgi:ABC-type sugar transport system ATPase subunit
MDATGLRCVGIDKSFGGVRALRGVDLLIRPGRVHALVGENGAGKSTLGAILGGALGADAGHLELDGEPHPYRSVRQAMARGVVVVTQETTIVPGLPVVDNVFLGIEPRRFGFGSPRRREQDYRALTEEWGIHLPPHRRAGDFAVAEQQQIELLRALAHRPQVLLLDEPTAALTPAETETLLAIVAKLRTRGKSVIYVSHFLDEVIEISDDVTILRDGEVVRTGLVESETVDTLVEGMVGRRLGLAFPPQRPPPSDAEVVLDVRGLADDRVGPLDLQVRQGEIVGVAGLVGSGRTRLGQLIFGARRRQAGTVAIEGQQVRPGSVHAAIRAGTAYLPESRRADGLVFGRSVHDNVLLVHGADYAVARSVVRRRSGAPVVRSMIAKLGIKTPSPRHAVDTLSGGNQQKVVLSKWLVKRPRLLIMDEPTRGVDVGAKAAIYEHITELAAEGTGILLISSELEEVRGLAHRVVVMRAGQVSGRFGSSASDRQIMAAAFGLERGAVGAAK